MVSIIRSFGEFTDIVYLKCSLSGTVENVYYMDHGQYDGIGGFQVLLENIKIAMLSIVPRQKFDLISFGSV